MSSFRKLADVLELFCPDSATEKKQTADTATGKSTVPDESRDERIRRVDEVIRKYRGRTYLEEMEEILKMNAYASTAGDHNTVSANAQWLLEQKAPEDMTPKERRLAVDLCCIADNYSLLKVLRQLDDKGER